MRRIASSLKCPVCNAKFRGTVVCTRCGGDLAPLMRVAAKAWELRRRAVAALKKGDTEWALSLVRRSRALYDTPLAKKTEIVVKTIYLASTMNRHTSLN